MCPDDWAIVLATRGVFSASRQQMAARLSGQETSHHNIALSFSRVPCDAVKVLSDQDVANACWESWLTRALTRGKGATPSSRPWKEREMLLSHAWELYSPKTELHSMGCHRGAEMRRGLFAFGVALLLRSVRWHTIQAHAENCSGWGDCN